MTVAKYTERLNQLLEDGTITQEQYDELADLSIAKEAIKEFNQVQRERDELAAFKQRIETAPQRKEAFKRVGIDYDALPKYGQKALDSIPPEKLDDLEFVAQYVKDEGFEATITPEEQNQEENPAAQIVDHSTTQGQNQQIPQLESYEAEISQATSPEQVMEIAAKHGVPVRGPQ